jgi:hypothetical protein
MNPKDMNVLDKTDHGRLWRLWLLVIALAFLVGCSPTATGGEAEADETAEMYAAVIRQIYTVDDTFGGTLQAPTLYVVRTTNDTAGAPDAEQSEPVVLSEEVQADITAQLQDLPTELVWVDTFEDVELNPETGEVPDSGAIVQVGNVHHRDDGSALISGSIYIANLAAGGQTYILEESNGEWAVTGNTGMGWIS